MKVTTGSGGFKPVELNITLESAKEVGAFYAIFNHGRIMDALPINGDSIRDNIAKAVGGRVIYDEYHDKLSKSFDGK